MHTVTLNNRGTRYIGKITMNHEPIQKWKQLMVLLRICIQLTANERFHTLGHFTLQYNTQSESIG